MSQLPSRQDRVPPSDMSPFQRADTTRMPDGRFVIETGANPSYPLRQALDGQEAARKKVQSAAIRPGEGAARPGPGNRADTGCH